MLSKYERERYFKKKTPKAEGQDHWTLAGRSGDTTGQWKHGTTQDEQHRKETKSSPKGQKQQHIMWGKERHQESPRP